MLYNAKHNSLQLHNGEMEYIHFGTGEKTLVMLPGLGDSLRSLKGTALPLAMMYREFSKLYSVYVFSRRKNITMGCSTKEMAQDLKNALDILGLHAVDLIGVSMGGMIAQHFAATYPDQVRKLCIVVSAARPNKILTESIEEWIMLAKADNHTAFMDSNIKRIYSEEYYNKNSRFIPAIARLTKPKSYETFYIQAQACLEHNSYDVLEKINCPTLVVGGERDLTLGGEASKEIAEKIPDAKLLMYPQWGHGLYEEATDFNSQVMDFLQGTNI